MLKRISNTNIKAMGVDAFLYDRLGGKMGEQKARMDEAKRKGENVNEDDLTGQAAMSLDAIIDKKKIKGFWPVYDDSLTGEKELTVKMFNLIKE